ncbi:uncharacterized protein STAUR_3213 [Stigmatella aurantiaca DW4/3-1]|uniref:Uncharacterized protein n=1 Tax=Stigmatella aurantiaca (strain DW4/3-1) TaxID=378806 RepID=E3FVH9_STIAD|nr:uncharacterized protein STAUR_3213 [Stigmatella aurantiaca DW4/3-1]
MPLPPRSGALRSWSRALCFLALAFTLGCASPRDTEGAPAKPVSTAAPFSAVPGFVAQEGEAVFANHRFRGGTVLPLDGAEWRGAPESALRRCL